MSYLLEHLHPMTREFGLIHAELQPTVDWFMDWRASITLPASATPVQGDLESLVLQLLPLNSIQPRRFLFVAMRGGWTAFFDNGWKGTGASVCGLIAQRMKCHACRVVVGRHTLDHATGPNRGALGGRIIDYFGPEPTEWVNLIRSIYVCANENKWDFEETGARLPLERDAWYAPRKVRDRFTDMHLEELLAGLGVTPFDLSAYEPRGYLLQATYPTIGPSEEYSLEEARAHFR